MDTIGYVYVPTACQNNSTGVMVWAVWREGRCVGVGCVERAGVMVWAVWSGQV